MRGYQLLEAGRVMEALGPDVPSLSFTRALRLAPRRLSISTTGGSAPPTHVGVTSIPEREGREPHLRQESDSSGLVVVRPEHPSARSRSSLARANCAIRSSEGVVTAQYLKEVLEAINEVAHIARGLAPNRHARIIGPVQPRCQVVLTTQPAARLAGSAVRSA